MSVLLLNSFGTKSAMNHEALKGRKMIGRGQFAAVFEGRKNTVLKMTVDQFNYYMHNDPYVGCAGRHFAKVLKNYGEIGMQGSLPIYLYEVELLDKLAPGTESRKLARKLSKKADSLSLRHRRERYNNAGSHVAYDTLVDLGQDKELPLSVRRALEKLADCVSNLGNGVELDMHLGNFMMRPKNGELVISDPIMDYYSFCKRQARLLRGG